MKIELPKRDIGMSPLEENWYDILCELVSAHNEVEEEKRCNHKFKANEQFCCKCGTSRASIGIIPICLPEEERKICECKTGYFKVGHLCRQCHRTQTVNSPLSTPSKKSHWKHKRHVYSRKYIAKELKRFVDYIKKENNIPPIVRSLIVTSIIPIKIMLLEFKINDYKIE